MHAAAPPSTLIEIAKGDTVLIRLPRDSVVHVMHGALVLKSHDWLDSLPLSQQAVMRRGSVWCAPSSTRYALIAKEDTQVQVRVAQAPSRWALWSWLSAARV